MPIVVGAALGVSVRQATCFFCHKVPVRHPMDNCKSCGEQLVKVGGR